MPVHTLAHNHKIKGLTYFLLRSLIHMHPHMHAHTVLKTTTGTYFPLALLIHRHSHMHTHTGTQSFIREQGLTYHLLRWFFPLCWLQSSRCETAFFPLLHWFPTPLYLAGKSQNGQLYIYHCSPALTPCGAKSKQTKRQRKTKQQRQQQKKTKKMEWANNCWWGSQNRTAVEKWTHLYSDTQETIKNTRAFDPECVSKVLVFLIVSCVSSHRQVHFSRAVLNNHEAKENNR